MKLQYKSVGVAGVTDQGDGIVDAIVSVTGIVDNVSDVIEPGAYTKTLQKRLPKGVWHHSWEKSVSKTLSIKELMPGDPELPDKLPNGDPWPADAGALKVKTQFNMGTQRGREAYSDVVFYGDQQEWSIGYHVPPDGATTQNGVRHIKTLELFEYSPVLFGAMGAARTTSVKEAQETVIQIKQLFGTDSWEEFLADINVKAGVTNANNDTDNDEQEDEEEEEEGTDITDDDDGTGEGMHDRDGKIRAREKAAAVPKPKDDYLETPDDYTFPDIDLDNVSADTIEHARRAQEAIQAFLASVLPHVHKNPDAAGNGYEDDDEDEGIEGKAAPVQKTNGKLPMPVSSRSVRQSVDKQAQDTNAKGSDDDDDMGVPTSIVQELDRHSGQLEDASLHQLAPLAQNFDHAIVGDDPEAVELAADQLLTALNSLIDGADAGEQDALRAIALAVASSVDEASDHTEKTETDKTSQTVAGEEKQAWSPGIVFETKDGNGMLSNGTRVSWHYRSAIGHGTIVGIHKQGATSADTEYSIREDDHHVSASGSKEPAVVFHYGRALTVEKSINYGVLDLTSQEASDVAKLHSNSAHIYADMRSKGLSHNAAFLQSYNVDKKRHLAVYASDDIIAKSSAKFVSRMEGIYGVDEAKEWEDTVAVKDYDIDYQIKRQFTAEARRHAGEAGHAMKNPDGTYSFPIENADDVTAAVDNIGRASDPDAAKKFIISRARELGCMNRIPDKWTGGGTDDGKSLTGSETKGDKVVIDIKELASLGIDLD